MDNLLYLDLSHNQITNIESDSFNELIRLQKLNLSDNYLKVIESNLFKNLSNFQSIYKIYQCFKSTLLLMPFLSIIQSKARMQ